MPKKGFKQWEVILKREDRDIWFPAKKYGYGWGLPITWQGWVVTLSYLLLIVGGSFTSVGMGISKHLIQKFYIDYDSIRRKNIFLPTVHHSGDSNAVRIAPNLEETYAEKIR